MGRSPSRSPQTATGRDDELRTLLAALTGEPNGPTPVFLIRGEHGIGRTHLVTAAASGAARVGANVLHGRGDPTETDLPYGALTHALAGMSRHGSPAVRRAVESVHRELSDATADDPDTTCGRVLDQMLRLVHDLAQDRPLVFVVDDLQDADEQTLTLLGALARRSGADRLVLILALTPGGRTGRRPLLRLEDELRKDCDLREVNLGPVDVRTVAVIAAAGTTEHEPEELHRRADGNPLIASHLTRADPDSSDLVRRMLPDGLDTEPVARVLAVSGPAQTAHLPAILEAACDDHPARAERGLDLLVAAGAVTEIEGTVGFRHEAVRAGLYALIGPAERSRIHRRLAQELLALRKMGRHVPFAEAARHAVAAAGGPDAEAAALAESAGDELKGADPGGAAAWFAESVRMTPPASAGWHGRVAKEAQALIRSGSFSAGIEMGQIALSGRLDEDERVRTVAHLTNARVRTGDEHALGLLEDEMRFGLSHRRLLLVRMCALHTSGQFAEAQTTATLAREACRLGGREARPDHALSLVYSAMIAADVGRDDEVSQHVDDAVDAATSAPLHVRGFVYGVCASLVARAGHVARARELRDLAAEYSAPGDERVLLADTLIQYFTGDWDSALAGAKTAIAPNGVDLQPGYAIPAAIQVSILVSRGDIEAARAALAALPPPAPPLATRQRTTRAWLELADLNPPAALELLNDVATWPDGSARLEALSITARALAQLGRHEEAHAGLAECSEAEDAYGPMARFILLSARSEVLGDLGAARDALTLAEEEGWILHQAMAQHALGLLDDDPAANLEAAWRSFRTLGADHWRRKTAEALRGRGLPVPRARRCNHEELTDLEKEIAVLVHAGLSNQQIADRLSYSRHSISAYLGRIYAKTSCSSRLELVRAVSEGLAC